MSARFSAGPRALAGGVKERDDLDAIWQEVVDDSIGPFDNLAQLREHDLRDGAARHWVSGDLL